MYVVFIYAGSTTQKVKFSSNDFFNKCDQIRWKLWIWSHLLDKSLMGNFGFLYSVENSANFMGGHNFNGKTGFSWKQYYWLTLIVRKSGLQIL